MDTDLRDDLLGQRRKKRKKPPEEELRARRNADARAKERRDRLLSQATDEERRLLERFGDELSCGSRTRRILARIERRLAS